MGLASGRGEGQGRKAGGKSRRPQQCSRNVSARLVGHPWASVTHLVGKGQPQHHDPVLRHWLRAAERKRSLSANTLGDPEGWWLGLSVTSAPCSSFS